MDFTNLKHYPNEKADIPIRYLHKEFANGERVLDPWQRLDRWSPEYKNAFIISILQGNDIPKIMEYILKGDETKKKRILDGGHRTRCIHEYISGGFGIKIGENYYYWTLPDEKTRGNSKNKKMELPEEYKHNFLNYKLTITTYTDLTDEEARERFNELNHCNPMDNAEVINSHSSLLVDNLRQFWDVNDSDVCNKLKEVFALTKKELDKLKYMKALVSLFTLIERKGKGDVFNYCEPKNSLVYVRSNDPATLNTQFSEEDFEVPWSNFVDSYNNYEEWINEMIENGLTLSNHSEALSYFHYINHCGINLTEEDNQKICEFSKNCTHYKEESPKYEKELMNVKNKPLAQIQEVQEKLKELNENVGQAVVEWILTFQTNGSGKSNLNKRKNILDRVLM